MEKIGVADLYPIFLAHKGKVFAKLQDELLQIGNDGFAKILFFIVFGNIKKLKNIRISQCSNSGMLFNKVVVLGCRKHRSFIKHTIDLTFKLSLAVSIGDTEPYIKFF